MKSNCQAPSAVIVSAHLPIILHLEACQRALRRPWQEQEQDNTVSWNEVFFAQYLRHCSRS